MKYLAPLFVLSLIVSSAGQLFVFAQSSADKSVNFAKDIDKAMDCAVRGVDVELCSKTLLSTSFEQDLENLTALLEQINASDPSISLLLGVNESLILGAVDDQSYLRVESVAFSGANFSYVLLSPALSVESFRLDEGESRALDLDGDEVDDVLLVLDSAQEDFTVLEFRFLGESFGLTANAIFGNMRENPLISPLWAISLILGILLINERVQTP